ncbi:MAG: alpha/beta hydrolase [Deltaproteobacteria bacterium]|nr:alpha/beta hydrolase [Deltaproteobacteria bacterium]
MTSPTPGNLTHRTVDVGEVRLHVVEAGPADGPLVVLLHGFPESWYCWRNQIPALAAAGYRVVAPDQRGYAESDKPQGVAAYRIERLVADVVGLIRSYGRERAHVVGHDWGAIVAWMLANDHPEILGKLVICNVAHPKRMIDGILFRPEQRMKSWYVGMFQLPVLPERMVRKDDFRGLRSMFRKDPVRAGAYTAEDIEHTIAALKHEGALTGAINWYRAAFRQTFHTRSRLRRIETPTLVLWGDRDRYISKALAEPPEGKVPNARTVHFDASHWLPSDAPDAVNAEILAFFGGTA